MCTIFLWEQFKQVHSEKGRIRPEVKENKKKDRNKSENASKKRKHKISVNQTDEGFLN
jgi:hypothetical protein